MVRRSTVCKFPVARIKKIMQADEDVGKVAAATPVVVSKSLEMFMASIIEATHEEGKRTGQRKLTPAHFKAAVHRHETFDFLKDIVDPIKDDGAGPSKGAAGGAASSSNGGGLKSEEGASSSVVAQESYVHGRDATGSSASEAAEPKAKRRKQAAKKEEDGSD